MERANLLKCLKGTQTARNLAAAFAGESQARNRYTFYEKVAIKECYMYVAAVFAETADNERAHAKIFFDLLTAGLGGEYQHIKVRAEYPIGFGNTLENLLYAAKGEKEEWGTLYPEFAAIAKKEGFSEIEHAFTEVAEVEEQHEERFLALYSLLKNGKMFKSDKKEEWKCMNCGYVHSGLEAPKRCPACHYPQGYFARRCSIISL